MIRQSKRAPWTVLALLAPVALLLPFKSNGASTLVLLEVGHPSVCGGVSRPWEYTSSMPIDLEEQSAAYAAVSNTVAKAEWLDGLFFWERAGPGGPYDRWDTPRGKPAMREAEKLLMYKNMRQSRLK